MVRLYKQLLSQSNTYYVVHGMLHQRRAPKLSACAHGSAAVAGMTKQVKREEHHHAMF